MKILKVFNGWFKWQKFTNGLCHVWAGADGGAVAVVADADGVCNGYANEADDGGGHGRACSAARSVMMMVRL